MKHMPNTAMPTIASPRTEPERYATSKALLSEVLAAVAVLTLALTATDMPRYPAIAEQKAPMM